VYAFLYRAWPDRDSTGKPFNYASYPAEERKHLADKTNHLAQRRRISGSAGPGTYRLSNTTRSRNTSSSNAATKPNNTAQPPDSTKEDHETGNGSAGVDDEALGFWDNTCAAMPPLSPATIEAIAVIVRRIDRRRAQQ